MYGILNGNIEIELSFEVLLNNEIYCARRGNVFSDTEKISVLKILPFNKQINFNTNVQQTEMFEKETYPGFYNTVIDKYTDDDDSKAIQIYNRHSFYFFFSLFVFSFFF